MLQVLGRVRGWARVEGGQRFVYRAAVCMLFALGLYFRSRRYWIDPIGLWADEASWGMRLFGRSLIHLDFRPVGYMALTKLAVGIYSNEQTLRILSYLAGVSSLALAFDVGRLLFRSRIACVLCLATVAFHPLLIDMAREFKPYSLEFGVHLGLVWLFLRWRARRTRAWFGVLLIYSVLAFLFAYNVVFLLPAIFALLGGMFLQQKAYRALLVTMAAAVTTLAVIGVVYFAALRGMGDTSSGKTFWGKKYGVFYLPSEADEGRVPQAEAGWVAHKYRGLAEFPAAQRARWVFPESVAPAVASGLNDAEAYGWLGLHALGLLALLLPGRRQLLVLLVGPVLVVVLFNLFGVWPFGAFRSNTFLLAYFILIPMVGLDALVIWSRSLALIPALLGCVLILIPNLTVGFDGHDRKYFFTGQSELRAVLRRLKALRERQPKAARRAKAYVLLDWYSCSPFEYYEQHNDSTNREFGDYLRKNFDFRCTKTLPGARAFMHNVAGTPLFVVVSDDRARLATRVMLRQASAIHDQERIRDTHDLYYVTAR